MRCTPVHSSHLTPFVRWRLAAAHVSALRLGLGPDPDYEDVLLTVSTDHGMLVGDLQTNLVTVERYRQDDGHSGSEDSDDLVDCDDVQDVSSEGFWDKLPVALALGAGDRGLFEEVSSTESSTWTTMPLPSDSLLDALIWSDLPGNAPAAASRRTAAATWLPRGVRDAGSSDLERVSGFAVLATAWLFIVRALRLVAHDACGTLP